MFKIVNSELGLHLFVILSQAFLYYPIFLSILFVEREGYGINYLNQIVSATLNKTYNMTQVRKFFKKEFASFLDILNTCDS